MWEAIGAGSAGGGLLGGARPPPLLAGMPRRESDGAERAAGAGARQPQVARRVGQAGPRGFLQTDVDHIGWTALPGLLHCCAKCSQMLLTPGHAKLCPGL